MRDDNPLNRTTAVWENLFTSTSYLRPIGHGDMSAMDREVWGWSTSLINEAARVEAYTKLVSAVLNQWKQIQQVCTEPYMTDPVYKVANMAMQQIGPNSPRIVYKPLEEQFVRLWIESPRPHDDSLRFLALNFGKYFPITRAEVDLLFELPGWAIVAIRIASGKGRTNDALAMIEDLHSRKVELSVSAIESFVEQGFSKTKAMKWLLLFHATKKSVESLRQEWEAELMAQGMTQEEIYRHEP